MPRIMLAIVGLGIVLGSGASPVAGQEPSRAAEDKRAEVKLRKAQLARAEAELALVEYEEETYPRQLAVADATIAAARGDQDKAKDVLDWSRKILQFGYVTASKVTRDELAFKKAEIALAEAVTGRRVLVEFTREKTRLALKAAVESARAEERVLEESPRAGKD